MDSTPSYLYGVVIAYNDARTPGLGSAIFLHVSHGSSDRRLRRRCRPTSCSTLLRWLDPARSPRIAIGTLASAGAGPFYDFLMPGPVDPDISLTPRLAEWIGGAVVVARPRHAETGRNGAHGADRRAQDRHGSPSRSAGTAPHPLPTPIQPGVELPPDGLRYRLKNKLLGPPLHTEQLEHERLGKPTALAVFASDNLSSSAYATEEMLRVLIPVDRARRVRARRADHRRRCSPCCCS